MDLKFIKLIVGGVVVYFGMLFSLNAQTEIVAQNYEDKTTFEYESSTILLNDRNRKNANLWGVVAESGSIKPHSGNNFYGMLNSGETLDNGSLEHVVSFDEIPISNYKKVQLSFYYNVVDYTEDDVISIEYSINKQSPVVKTVMKGTETSSKGWEKYTLSIPGKAESISFKLIFKQNQGFKFSGLDTIELEGKTITPNSEVFKYQNNFKSLSNDDNKTIIFPNPASDFVSIKTISGQFYVVFYSVLGELVLSAEVNNDKIDIRSLPSGSYYVSTYTEKGGQFTSKLTVEK